MNKITLIGNLTHDPEVRSTPNGVTVCTFTIAVNRRFAQQGGEKATDFFRINAWRQLGENCARYLAKGRKVAVIGELQARTYEGKDGATRMSLDVSADEVEFLTPRSQDEGSGYSAPRQNNAAPQDLAGFTDIQSDDIPF
ncbi:MAG: single-stranded DNA-binding protein [Eubacteriales bacterium]|nr:single-stranded DNA-binding protein [Eubacteriales bacterium]